MQKLIIGLISSAVISGLSVSNAVASPILGAGHVVKITADCPDIGTKSEFVTNYGTYLAGTGFLRVNSDVATTPLFQGPIVPGSDIPTDLVAGGYFNDGVMYNPSNGAVICNYSSFLGHDGFQISYMMQNALNGVVAGSGAEEIHIKIPAGLR